MNVLFVDMPRTAGNSILSAIGRPEGIPDNLRHLSCRDWVKNIGHHRWEAMTRMTVIRHPVDRFVSAYYYLTGQKPGHRFWAADKREREDIGGSTLNEVARWPQQALFRMEHFRPQMFHLIGESGAVEVQHVLRFERLAEAWAEFAEEFGLPPELPHTNAVMRPKSWREELTSESLDSLKEAYAVDCEVLNYTCN
jgi:hypothetical protein